MRRRKRRQRIAVLLIIALVFPPRLMLWAREDEAGLQVSGNHILQMENSAEEIISEEIISLQPSVSQNQGEIKIEDNQENLEQSVSDNLIEENKKEIQRTLEEELSPEKEKKEDEKEDGPQEEAVQFPGLEEGHRLSPGELEEKENLKENLARILSLEEGLDYVENEIIVAAGNEAEALQYAKAFGGELKRYIGGNEGFAVITLNQKEEKKEEKVQVEEAVLASVSEEILLPPAWPNYYYSILEEMNIETQDGETGIQSIEVMELNPAFYNDPYLKESSGYYQWHHAVIGSAQAWAYGYTGKGIKVAVLDTGLNPSHEDIQAQTHVIDENIGSEDTNGHGTHVAALIGAKGNNGLGGVGVAPDAEIISLKVIGERTGTTDTIIAGIQKAIECDADIINLSLGSVVYHGLFERKVMEAYEAGIAVFGAAGNDGSNSYYYPAAFQGAIMVGALDKSNQRAAFSNHSSAVRYVAPGASIVSATINGSNRYSALNGTSQATPITAGIAAILLSSGKVQGEGSKRVDNLLKIMDNGCIKVSGSGMGKGYISLIKSLGLDNSTSSPSAPVISLKSGTYRQKAIEVSLSVPPGSTVFYTLDGKNITIKDGRFTEGIMKYNPGELLQIEGKSTVVLKARAVSNGNGMLSKQVSATYNLKPAAAQISIYSQNGEHRVAAGKSLQLKTDILPSYTADKGVKWQVQESGKGISVSGGKVTVKSSTEPGEYRIIATAKNERGAYSGVSDTFVIEVVKEENPVSSVKFQTKSVNLNVAQQAEIKPQITKKDKTIGEITELLWKVENENIAKVELVGQQLLVKGIKKGTTKLVGTTRDGYGKQFFLPITVKQPVEKIIISGSATVATGKSISLKANIEPADANNKSVIWSVLPREGYPLPQVSVNASGKVTAKAKALEAMEGEAGYCIIQAKAKDGSQVLANYSLTVTKGKMTSLKPEKSSIQLFRVENPYQSATSQWIGVEIMGDNTDLWQAESNKPGLVTVEKEGQGFRVTATGTATGTATITLSSLDGSNLKKSCRITVCNPPSQLKIAPVSGRSQYLAKGKKLRLIPVFETAYGSISQASRKLEWTSNKPEAVRVDKNGYVTALTEDGTSVYITAKTVDGSNLSAGFYIRTCSETKKLGLKDYEIKNNVLQKGSAYAFEFFFENTGSVNFYPSKETVLHRDRAGLEPYYISVSGGKKLGLMANKKGTYRITLSLKDGSTSKKTYVFKVVEK